MYLISRPASSIDDLVVFARARVSTFVDLKVSLLFLAMFSTNSVSSSASLPRRLWLMCATTMLMGVSSLNFTRQSKRKTESLPPETLQIKVSPPLRCFFRISDTFWSGVLFRFRGMDFGII